jgi:mRNA interferase MazF
VNRGDVYDVEFPSGRRPAVVATRDVAIPLLRSVTVVEITGTVRGVPTEVPLGTAEGLLRDCVANCDNLQTVSKDTLIRRRGSLGREPTHRLNMALTIALGLD